MVMNDVDKLKELISMIVEKLKEMSDRIKVLEAAIATTQTSSLKEEVMSDEKTEAYSVEEAPEWYVYYKVNTSEGIYKAKVKQKAWTEKQAIYLGRTEQLFKHMSGKVKAKEIEPKWSIIETSAEKVD
jgi:hypothetical protein